MNSKIVFFLIFPFSSFCLQLPHDLALRLIRSKTTAFIDNVFDNECASDLRSLLSEASDSKLWALKMLDASGKVVPGVLEGNLHFLGDYEECLSINENVNNRIIQGQYCSVSLTPNKELLAGWNLTSLSQKAVEPVLVLGLCVPKSCTVDDLANTTKYLEESINVKPHFHHDLCHYDGKPIEFDTLDDFVYWFFVIISVLVVTGTVYDVYFRNSGEAPNFFVSFSVYNNTKRLLSEPSGNDTLSCINGIRVLTCFWVILGHTGIGTLCVSKNLVFVFQHWLHQMKNTILWTSCLAVDSIFTLSGLLLSYTYLKYVEKRPVPILSFYVHRYIRIVPVFLATIFIETSIMKTILTGPYALYTFNLLAGNCKNSWWKVFFFFISRPECIDTSWHITMDTRYYLLAPFILPLLKKYPKKFMAGTLLIITLCITYTFVVSLVYEIHATPLLYIFIECRHQILNFLWWFNYYYRELIHHSYISNSPGWLIGIVFGYCLYYKKIEISKRLNNMFWIISLFVMLNIIIHQSHVSANEHSVYPLAVWNALSKPLWCLSLSFITYSCATGTGGLINTFLSLPTFRVLSKMTYIMFMIHHFVVLLVIFSLRYDSVHYNSFQMFSMYLTVQFFVIAFSVPLYLCLEAPIDCLKNRLERGKAVVSQK